MASLLIAWILVKKKYTLMFHCQVGILILMILAAFNELPLIQYASMKVFSDKILELRKPGDQVVMYKHYFSSLPFYLNEPVMMVGVPAEVSFDSNWEKAEKNFWNPNAAAIQDFIKKPNRIFILLEGQDKESLRSLVHQPLFPILQRGEFALFSNRL